MLGYHLDTARSLKEGTVIGPYTNYADLGKWGISVFRFLDSIKDPVHILPHQAIALLERDVEHVRLTRFPDKPSRLCSLFAARTLDELVMQWIPKLVKAEPVVWEVESQGVGSLHDAAWLDGLNIVVEVPPADTGPDFERICKYWEGCFSSAPLPELLLPLPCRVVRRVTL